MDTLPEKMIEALEAHLVNASIPDHIGDHYYSVLKRIHDILHPECYLEVGTRTGESLALATCPSIAIDPRFNVTKNVIGGKPLCAFFQISSDEFFRKINPTTIFDRRIDFAFLDGMHLFEFLLRDFSNTEKHCNKNSIIALHDCLPPEASYTTRQESDLSMRSASRHPDWWAGDVWKTSIILKKLRPDLKLLALDAAPTGIILITNLNPNSDFIDLNYFDIVSEYKNLTLEDYGINNLVRDLQVTPTSEFKGLENISSWFWL